MHGPRRIVTGLIGLVLVVTSFFVMFDGMWIQSGLGAFSEQWGGRLQSHFNVDSYQAANTGGSLPSAQVFNQDLWNFAGRRAFTSLIVAQTIMLVFGVILMVMAAVPPLSQIEKDRA